MGEVDEVKLDVTAPWTNIALDLMSLILIKAMVNKRARCKVCPLIVFCLGSGATHTEILADYGAQAFICGYERFVARRGRPS